MMSSSDESETSVPVLAHVRAPWGTMFVAFISLFLFGGLLFVVYHYSGTIDSIQVSNQGDQQLQVLKNEQRQILESDGYDPQTKAYRIPIDRAMKILIDEATANQGQLKTYPMLKTKP